MVKRLRAHVNEFLRVRAIRQKLERVTLEIDFVGYSSLPDEARAQLILNLLKQRRALEIDINSKLTLR